MDKSFETRKIVFFDGECNLCNKYVQRLLHLDKKEKFIFASLQSTTAQEILSEFHYKVDSGNLETVVYLCGEQVFEKSNATIRIANDIGWPYKAMTIFLWIPRPFRDHIYNQIAKRRYKIFGKRDSCMAPTPELKNRFIE